MHALLQGGTYKIEQLTIRFTGEPVEIPPGAILVGAGHTFNGAYQLVLLIPDGKRSTNKTTPARQRQKGGR